MSHVSRTDDTRKDRRFLAAIVALGAVGVAVELRWSLMAVAIKTGIFAALLVLAAGTAITSYRMRRNPGKLFIHRRLVIVGSVFSAAILAII